MILSCKHETQFTKKPTSMMNISFGIPDFIQLDVLNSRNYLADGNLYLRIRISESKMHHNIMDDTLD